MTEYGAMINGQLVIHKQYHDGDKPIIKKDEPIRDGCSLGVSTE